MFRRETTDGNRVTGVMRAVIGEDLDITYIIKTALVGVLFFVLILETLRHDINDYNKARTRRLSVPAALATI